MTARTESPHAYVAFPHQEEDAVPLVSCGVGHVAVDIRDG